ncbi:LacI family transcriptional regulator [Propioniciclava coleopterorum]|uniref:LacI family transcriptional regulator n=1 Tax=Propioniciclava coleopterorum TaxID=2714937 RepID=A0A6G7Y3Z1_9ACTN|nr:LacI family DNA-binding transcriptional regulator [Propioniciclava coleopterorum]QIK71532.1 LacI family transcriptional regulator [Propioniciclava coleopterorum]
MTVTATEVARRLGLSQSTVSRALAGSPLVSAATRERVEEAARAMGYRPNAAGRSLKVGRHGTLGIVVPDLAGGYGAGVATGVLAAAAARGDQLLVADSGGTPAGELAAFETLASQADGVVLLAPRCPAPELTAAVAGFRHVVVVGRSVPGLDSVLADEAPSITALLDHLTALGHRTIGYQGGPSAAPSERLRRAGLRDYCARHPGVTLVRLDAEGLDARAGLVAADEVVARGLGAVLAFNDQTGLALIGRLRTLGVDVPGEVSVACWDDTALTAIIPPHLTTVSLALAELAAAASERLYALLADPAQPPTTTLLPSVLRVRDSTGPARR